jgi:hypothetical protein
MGQGFSPLLNLYAFIFLFGGAVYSAIQYFAIEKARTRFLGTSSLPLVRLCRAWQNLYPVWLRGGLISRSSTLT